MGHKVLRLVLHLIGYLLLADAQRDSNPGKFTFPSKDAGIQTFWVDTTMNITWNISPASLYLVYNDEYRKAKTLASNTEKEYYVWNVETTRTDLSKNFVFRVAPPSSPRDKSGSGFDSAHFFIQDLALSSGSVSMPSRTEMPTARPTRGVNAGARSTAATPARTGSANTGPSKSDTKLGVGLGVGLGVPLAASILIGVFFLGRARRRSKSENQKVDGDSPRDSSQTEMLPPYEKREGLPDSSNPIEAPASSVRVPEADSHGVPHSAPLEMPANTRPIELQG
ncbi:MAG: hypothetical protein M1831_006163 [Alyxoria varia]|nr:MAG: hypothetical protein M1831_006163 [Alyxoria varia]